MNLFKVVAAGLSAAFDLSEKPSSFCDGAATLVERAAGEISRGVGNPEKRLVALERALTGVAQQLEKANDSSTLELNRSYSVLTQAIGAHSGALRQEARGLGADAEARLVRAFDKILAFSPGPLKVQATAVAEALDHLRAFEATMGTHSYPAAITAFVNPSISAGNKGQVQIPGRSGPSLNGIERQFSELWGLGLFAEVGPKRPLTGEDVRQLGKLKEQIAPALALMGSETLKRLSPPDRKLIEDQLLEPLAHLYMVAGEVVKGQGPV